jgi:hypothetical protein
MLHTHIGRKPSVCVCVVVFGEDDAQEKESDHSTDAADTNIAAESDPDPHWRTLK